MKLPDFRYYAPLNRLKAQMGIAADEFGSNDPIVANHTLTDEELNKLASGVGIDVGWEDLTLLINGTFVYKDTRVLIYIRDVRDYGERMDGPRYHLATCSTIENMHLKGRLQRYVIATKSDGIFHVNITSQFGTRSEQRQLKVCQNCLEKLDFDGFHLKMPASKRNRIVSDFTPVQFFAKYPKSFHSRLPSHSADGSPLNDYTADFPEISRKLREAAEWRCSTCRRVLIAPGMRQYLHVHHVDGNRLNNSTKNLKVVCIECHSNEPDHAHMRNSPEYAAYMRIMPPIPR